MQKWVLVVETNCNDADKESEFNDWYNNIHVPDMLETPGFMRTTRFQNSNPAEGRGKFVAFYEIETEDLGQAMTALQKRFGEVTEQGRMSPLCAIAGATPLLQIYGPVESK